MFRKGFGEELDAEVQDAAVGDDVGGVAGHVKALRGGLQGFNFCGQVAAVHVGQDDIGQQQVDPAVVVLGQGQGFFGGISDQGLVAQSGEHSAGEFEYRGLVLDHQDGLSPAGDRLLPFIFSGGAAGTVMPGQVDLEGRAFLFFAVDIDEAVVLFDDAVDCGQAQSGPFAHLFGGEKGLEDFILGGGVHAAAVVADDQRCELSGCEARVVGAIGLVQGGVSGFNGDFAGIGDGVAGVDAQVGQDLFNLGGVYLDRPQA